MTQAQFRALAIGQSVYSPIAPSTPLIVHNAYYRFVDGRFVFFVAFDGEGRATVSQDESLVADLSMTPGYVDTWKMAGEDFAARDTSGFQTSPLCYVPQGFSNTNHDYFTA